MAELNSSNTRDGVDLNETLPPRGGQDDDETSSQEKPAATALSQSDSHDSDDEEEIRAWQLHFQFVSRNISHVWKGLQNAGWTYKNNPATMRHEYFCPDDLVIKQNEEAPTANESRKLSFEGKALLRYLDLFRVPDITNTLQLPPRSALSDLSPQEEQKGRELRNQAIREIYKVWPRDKSPDDGIDATDDTTVAETADVVAAKRPARRRSTRGQGDTSATTFDKGADAFLRRNKGIKSVSTQDIAFLKFPSVKECIDKFRDYPTEEIDNIEASYKKDFDDWLFLLTTQNSLLLHGFGSKRHLLEAFAQDKLEDEGDVLAIDGYDREVRLDTLLDVIVDQFLDGVEATSELGESSSCRVGVTASSLIGTHNVVRRATRIAQCLAVKQRSRRCPLFLVLHNIDGPQLRSRDIQEALAALVSHSTVEANVNAVRLVASIDHVNASALLWDNPTSANFSWVWKEVHTYRPYAEELAVTAVEEPRQTTRARGKAQVNDGVEDTNMLNVLHSLASRHADVVKVLATLQSEDSKPVEHSVLFQNCKHKMIVTNNTMLRGYLTELVDHGIVEVGKDATTGREWLRIPYSREKLLEIRDFQVE